MMRRSLTPFTSNIFLHALLFVASLGAFADLSAVKTLVDASPAPVASPNPEPFVPLGLKHLVIPPPPSPKPKDDPISRMKQKQKQQVSRVLYAREPSPEPFYPLKMQQMEHLFLPAPKPRSSPTVQERWRQKEKENSRPRISNDRKIYRREPEPFVPLRLKDVVNGNSNLFVKDPVPRPPPRPPVLRPEPKRKLVKRSYIESAEEARARARQWKAVAARIAMIRAARQE